jgi:hypothetical protein
MPRSMRFLDRVHAFENGHWIQSQHRCCMRSPGRASFGPFLCTMSFPMFIHLMYQQNNIASTFLDALEPESVPVAAPGRAKPFLEVFRYSPQIFWILRAESASADWSCDVQTGNLHRFPALVWLAWKCCLAALVQPFAAQLSGISHASHRELTGALTCV